MQRTELAPTLATVRLSVSVRVRSSSVQQSERHGQSEFLLLDPLTRCSPLRPSLPPYLLPSLLPSFLLPSSSLGESTLKGRLFDSLPPSLTHSTRRHRPWPWETDCESVSGQRHRFHSIHPRFNKSSTPRPSLRPSFFTSFFTSFRSRSSFLQFCTLSHNASPDDWFYRRFQLRLRRPPGTRRGYVAATTITQPVHRATGGGGPDAVDGRYVLSTARYRRRRRRRPRVSLLCALSSLNNGFQAGEG